jgi:hypothetical protein
MDIILSIIGFIILACFIAFSIWLGATIILLVLASSFFLAVFIVLRSYYLQMRYGGKPPVQRQSSNKTVLPGEQEATIIDVEFHDVSDK